MGIGNIGCVNTRCPKWRCSEQYPQGETERAVVRTVHCQSLLPSHWDPNVAETEIFFEIDFFWIRKPYNILVTRSLDRHPMDWNVVINAYLTVLCLDVLLLSYDHFCQLSAFCVTNCWIATWTAVVTDNCNCTLFDCIHENFTKSFIIDGRKLHCHTPIETVKELT